MKNNTPPPASPTEAEIRVYAHELYLQSGRLPGRDLDNWLEAEAQLAARAKIEMGQRPSRAARRRAARAPTMDTEGTRP